MIDCSCQGMEAEKQHWEQIVSDLSLQIKALQDDLTESELQKRELLAVVMILLDTLKAKIEAIESDGSYYIETPQPVRGKSRGEPPLLDYAAESVRLYKKLEREDQQMKDNQGRLNMLTNELEDIRRRREERRAEIKRFQTALNQLKVEKSSIMKKISEQEKQ